MSSHYWRGALLLAWLTSLLALGTLLALRFGPEHLESPLRKPLGSLFAVVPMVLAAVWLSALAVPRWGQLKPASRVLTLVPVLLALLAVAAYCAWF